MQEQHEQILAKRKPANLINPTDQTKTTDQTSIANQTDITDQTRAVDQTSTIDPGSSHANILKRIASEAWALMAELEKPDLAENPPAQ